MVQPTNLTSNYDYSNLRKLDQADNIVIIDPTDTPFRSIIMSNGQTSKASAIEVSWNQRTLRSTSTSSQRLEGDDANFVATVAPSRPSNITQINEQAAVVSSTSERTEFYGVDDPLDFEISIAAIDITRDIEATIFGNQAKVNTNETTARKAAGLPTWIGTNISLGSGGTAAGSQIDGAAARTDGTQRDLTENMVTTVAKSVYDAGGKLDYLFCGSFVKTVVNKFTGVVPNVNVVSESDPLLVMGSVDIYDTGIGGKVRVMPDLFQRARDLFLLQMDMFEIAEMMPLQSLELARTGILNRKADVGTEWTLKVLQEKASGAVYDLNVS